MTSLKRTTRPPFLPSVREGGGGDKEKAMKQFAALLRKDNQPVRYLVVDDSVFARKNLIKMIEMFGGEVAGGGGGGLTPLPGIKRSQPGIVLLGITHAPMERNGAVGRIGRQHTEEGVVVGRTVGFRG